MAWFVLLYLPRGISEGSGNFTSSREELQKVPVLRSKFGVRRSYNRWFLKNQWTKKRIYSCLSGFEIQNHSFHYSIWNLYWRSPCKQIVFKVFLAAPGKSASDKSNKSSSGNLLWTIRIMSFQGYFKRPKKIQSSELVLS